MVTPQKLTLRCYDVGFGDCFLLTFQYPDATGDRHVLIDFGSTQKPPKGAANMMDAIAADIEKAVGGQLHVIVATHRHTDHISGFATNSKGTGTGDRIARLKPQLVIQPWTEQPDAPKDFQGPQQKGLTAAADSALRLSLDRMRVAAKGGIAEAAHLPQAAADEITFIGADGLENMSAVQNLARMGKRAQAEYVYYGKKIPALASLLPGVKVDVLGPPTIRQKSDVLKENPNHPQEYWNFANFWKLRAATAEIIERGDAHLFPRAEVYGKDDIPMESRWFLRRLRDARGQQLLRIVRAMDDALNNTSVILLFGAGKKKFLFPGDAQWENWEYALGKNLPDLKDVDVYKVGHHGSLNATPKTLWNNFAKRSKQSAAGRLCSVMSTRSNSKHGSRAKGTEVPREKLVDALRTLSDLRTTQELEASGGLVLKLEFDLS
jgi:hypothetical protein